MILSDASSLPEMRDTSVLRLMDSYQKKHQVMTKDLN